MDFATLLNSAKPREHTDRFKTVAALYCLGANSNPVTSGKVDALLKLHLGKKAPKNVSDALRKNSRFISVASKGPPLLWKLLDSGVAFLTEKTGQNLSSKISSTVHQVDIAIVCALEFPEFEAVVRASGGATSWKEISDPNFPHVYREAKITAASGEQLRVVGVTSTELT